VDEYPVIDLSHLLPAAQGLARLPADERIQRIRADRWIGYPRAVEALNRLETLYAWPNKQRMPNLLLVGPTNNGKSMIVEKFRRAHPVGTDADQEHIPVLVVQMPSEPSVIRFYVALLAAMGAPLRIICPGGVYRADYDQTHTPMFHQVEGLALDKNISMANLKWVLEEFVKSYFEVDSVDLRFRASHFPFTEPSAEVDIRCSWKDGTLKIGEGDDWLEILGSGMVHPKVIAAGGIDPDVYQGFAFGMGIDRIAMLKYGIPDLRAFFDSDLRWLRHYGFQCLDVPTLHGGLSR